MRANRRHALRSTLRGLAAIAAAGFSGWALRALEVSPLTRFLIAVLPAIPSTLYVIDTLRIIGRLDELQRRISHESLVFAFGGNAVMVVRRGCLDKGHLVPALTWEALWFTVAFTWMAGDFIASLRYR